MAFRGPDAVHERRCRAPHALHLARPGTRCCDAQAWWCRLPGLATLTWLHLRVFICVCVCVGGIYTLQVRQRAQTSAGAATPVAGRGGASWTTHRRPARCSWRPAGSWRTCSGGASCGRHTLPACGNKAWVGGGTGPCRGAGGLCFLEQPRPRGPVRPGLARGAATCGVLLGARCCGRRHGMPLAIAGVAGVLAWHG